MPSTAATLLRASLLSIAAPLAAAGCGGRTGAATAGTEAAVAGAAGAPGGTSGTGGTAAGGLGGLSGTGGGSSAGAAGFESGPPAVCVDPMPVIVQGIDTGFDRCAAGELRRRAIVACPAPPPGPGCANGGVCHADAECTAGPYGSCSQDYHFANECKCFYACVTDAECGDAGICVCGESGGQCAAAFDCKTDGDCGGGLCASVILQNQCPIAFLCTRPGDQCEGSDDCSPPGPGGSCLLPTGTFGAAKRVCAGTQCGTGRPIVIEAKLRVARPVSRRDWTA